MRNLHAEITERILAQLAKGVVPWRKPWSTKSGAAVPAIMPQNAITGRRYSGVNVLLLWGKMDDGAFSDARFLTFKQAKEAGGTVRKGEKGTEVVYVNFVEREDKETGKPVRIPFLKAYHVFNVAQCDGLNLKADGAPRNARVARNARDAIVDAFIASTGATIRHGEPRAYYTTAGDFINLPVFDSFVSGHAYYATAFHELGHWTGGAARLNRQFGRRFGDRAYSAEELVAELTSAFVCAEFAIDNNEQSAAYLATWLKATSDFLASHQTAIVAAAAAASKAVDYLRGAAIADDMKEAA
jgi:antirestriction protein ArdC